MHIYICILMYIYRHFVRAIYSACLFLRRAFFQNLPRGAAREAARWVECPRATLRCHPCGSEKEDEHIPGDMPWVQVKPDV